MRGVAVGRPKPEGINPELPNLELRLVNRDGMAMQIAFRQPALHQRQAVGGLDDRRQCEELTNKDTILVDDT